ncbi:MerR family transcriptional regulator [Streptomyces sp. Je 1-369]|uniref:MerR family transcriptional regulator n=1 Tax=Streptomyces sp. Je 1-369 TaxID=2966192 RepID=UPI0022861A90|nr:MerR family transcriptional regulator [Streptomyces sp. Je 1-369]WAL94115.1 MerR family transcriptional regulator [Streptomyces sp. Je 1-369]
MNDSAAALTSGAVARRLGVSPTTLRSWDRRYGLGPAARTQGRHRRWTPEDIAVLEHMCRLTAGGIPPGEAARLASEGSRAPSEKAPGESGVPPTRPRRRDASTVLPLSDVRQECRGLARAAVRLDAQEMQSRLDSLVGEHGLVPVWEEVMVPTLRAVGRKWELSDDRYVEVEHLLSWHISTTLRSAPLLRPRTAPLLDTSPVLLACMPDEQHTLPLEALNAALGEKGVPTRMLGAAVPPEALVAAVRRTGPSAVVLWSQARSTAGEAVARRVAAMEWGPAGARRRALVLPAGPGWGRTTRTGPARVGNLRDAVTLLSTPHPG